MPPSSFHAVAASGSAPSAAIDTERSAALGRLEQVYRQERARLVRYLGRQVGCDAAPDLVQEVFLRAAGSQQLGILDNPAGFLRRIARNLLIDRARRARTAAILVPLDEARDAPVAADQELALEAADLLHLYEQALEAFPEKTRRVFLMHRVDELTYREIHKRLGISVATVEYHMMKALARLSEAMDAQR